MKHVYKVSGIQCHACKEKIETTLNAIEAVADANVELSDGTTTYQKGDLGYADGSGVQGRVAYNIGSGFTIGTILSYDDAFDGRVSADILYRFATPEAPKAPVKKAGTPPR